MMVLGAVEPAVAKCKGPGARLGSLVILTAAAVGSACPIILIPRFFVAQYFPCIDYPPELRRGLLGVLVRLVRMGLTSEVAICLFYG